MKKTTLFIVIASILFITGCQQPIYEAIREDVAPEEATVSGAISSITRYTAGSDESGEYLFLAADGGLRYKQKDNTTHDSWKKFSLPFSLNQYDYDSTTFSGEQILTVLANDKYLYLITAENTHTEIEGLTYPANIKLWGAEITESGDSLKTTDAGWILITENNPTLFPIVEITGSSDTLYSSNFRVFQTNAPKKDHRAAFIRSYSSTDNKWHYYKLTGLDKFDESSMPSEYSISTTDIIDPTPSDNEDYIPVANSAAFFDDELKFFTSTVATTNETYKDNATLYYYTNSSKRLYYKGSKEGYVDGDYTINSLATTTDSIIIGYGYLGSNSTSSKPTAGGIGRAIFNEEGNLEITTFKNNATFQITSSYIVLALINATPDKTESESNLYAAITFSGTGSGFSNIGLWSYYPDRGNWNRE